MAKTSLGQLKQWFVTGSKPVQSQYYSWMDSFWHKDEEITISSIDGLQDLIEGKADATQLEFYAKKDATNIEVAKWRTVLGVGSADLSNYYTKAEIDSLWVSTATTPATQAEVEASTGSESQPLSAEPSTENRKFLSLFNFFKLIKKLRYIHLLPNSATAVANRLWSNGFRLYYANNSAVASTVAYTSDLPTTFLYTPTGNFTLSQIKTASEAAGLIFNGLHIILNIGTNNFTLTIDNGAANNTTVVTLGKRGATGSINVLSVRTMVAFDLITVMNGDENATAKIDLGTTKDFIKINNG